MASAASHSTLNYSTTGRIAEAVFARPDELNSLSEETLDDLNDVVASVQADDSVRALVISGQGEAFSVGLSADLLTQAYGDLEYFEHVLTRLAATCLSLEALDVPVIAKVGGTARAAGFELALACDMIVISDSALIGDGQVAAGVVPGGGASVRLPRIIGVQQAREIVFSGRLLTGEEAAKLGLVLRSVPAAQLDGAVAELAAAFTDKSRRALATAKRQINRGLGVDTPTGVEQERRELISYLREPNSDAIEGFRAEQEKRQPSWV
jgi:enoyl-CoA hydratase/carnithine racemase